MSNILIIKHGSLGDIAQASGAIQDISENHKDDQIYLLTTKPYFDLFKKNSFIHEVILDKRLPRYNLIYLYFLMRELKKHNFSKVFDLQNSSRTNFYKNILFPKGGKTVWSSSITTLPNDKSKDEFDKSSVLERFDHQLKESGLNTSNTLKPDFNWASKDISEIKISYKIDKYILLFPFCSPHLSIKKWPHYNKLIELISNNNSRVKWITGSRILASVHLFSEKIEIPEHKEIFETQKLKYKTIISDILEDKDKSGAFFYGSDDWSESIDEAAKKSTIPEKDQKAQGLISTLKGIAEVSLHTLWEFTLFPKNYEDPLKNEGFNDDEINFKVQSRFPGLFDYLKHKRKCHSINGELVEYEKKR